MKIEILMSCMHQKDAELVKKSQLTGHVVMINQCNTEGYAEYPNEQGMIRIFSTIERGLTKSRNMAIEKSDADICMLCDDDESFVPEYEAKIKAAYERLPQADVIIFKMENYPCPFPDKIMKLHFPYTLNVSSWQISFRRNRLKEKGVAFDELLGAGTGNGAEEELKFLTDCEKAKLQIYYVPVGIASVAQTESTWFAGFTETFFVNRGATTRYILGFPLASLYAVYYVLKKREKYKDNLTIFQAFRAIFRGMLENKIGKQKKAKK